MHKKLIALCLICSVVGSSTIAFATTETPLKSNNNIQIEATTSTKEVNTNTIQASAAAYATKFVFNNPIINVGQYYKPSYGMYYNMAIVKADVLSVRKNAGTNYPIIGSVYNGRQVEVHITTAGWSFITYNVTSTTSKCGWVSSAYLTF